MDLYPADVVSRQQQQPTTHHWSRDLHRASSSRTQAPRSPDWPGNSSMPPAQEAERSSDCRTADTTRTPTSLGIFGSRNLGPRRGLWSPPSSFVRCERVRRRERHSPSRGENFFLRDSSFLESSLLLLLEESQARCGCLR